MRLHIRYFARIRDLMGRSEETVELEDNDLDGAGLIDWLSARTPEIADQLHDPSIRLVLNEEFCTMDHQIRDGDAVALVPPFSGG